MYDEVLSAAPYRDLPRIDFDQALQFVSDGGYALRVYDRSKKVTQHEDTNQYAIASLITLDAIMKLAPSSKHQC